MNANGQPSSIKKGQVAPTFEGFDGVLLIRKGPYSFTEAVLESKFRKNYTGEIIFLVDNRDESSKYADMQKYPFIVTLMHDNKEGIYFYRFIMTERLTGKEYRSSGFPSNSIPPYAGIGKYAKSLEKIRKKE
jgi:hypothetical protein